MEALTKIIFRRDLAKSSKELTIDIINSTTLRYLGGFQEADVVLFIDDDGQTKILKNRWGIDTCIVNAKKNDRAETLRLFKGTMINQTPMNWHIWKRAFDCGFNKAIEK